LRKARGQINPKVNDLEGMGVTPLHPIPTSIGHNNTFKNNDLACGCQFVVVFMLYFA
jgi:hypothetical protein